MQEGSAEGNSSFPPCLTLLETGEGREREDGEREERGLEDGLEGSVSELDYF